MAANKRELPVKEQQVFRQLINFYETKEYKKGLKSADQILKKLPEHGETLAMKGLFLSHLDKKEEAHEFIKKGLKFDLTSPICWHVYGLLHRAEKNYEEAIKCYSQSLRLEKVFFITFVLLHYFDFLTIFTFDSSTRCEMLFDSILRSLLIV